MKEMATYWLYYFCCLWRILTAEWTAVPEGLPSLQGGHPSKMSLGLTWEGDSGNITWISLNLTKTDNSPKAVPIYEGDNSGTVKLIKISSLTHSAFYQDLENNAAITLTAGPHGYFTRGSFTIDNDRYQIEPDNSRVNKRSTEDKRQEHLHIISRVKRENAANSIGIEELMDETVEKIGQPNIMMGSVRRKRETKQTMTVNLYMVIDSKLYEKMTTWHSEFGWTGTVDDFATYTMSHMVNEIDMRFQSIKSDLYDFKIKLGYLMLAKTVETSPWTQVLVDEVAGKTDALSTIKSFRDWANDESSGLPADADQFMLMTGYNLHYANSGVDAIMGYAYIGGICLNNRVAVTEYLGYSTIVAHELAHNLGAKHDGQDNDCLSSSQNVMSGGTEATSGENVGNTLIFSDCSVAYFESTIQALDASGDNCLTDAGTVTAEFVDDMKTKIGQVIDINQQCRMRFGEGAAFAGSVSYADEVCNKMRCYSPTSQSIKVATAGAFPYTTCGDKKWCVDERCVWSADAPNANPACPLGEHPGRLYKTSTFECPNALSLPRKCYSSVVETFCCESCPQVLKPANTEACRYGDRHNICSTMKLGKGCDTYSHICCETCAAVYKPHLGPFCQYGDRENDYCDQNIRQQTDLVVKTADCEPDYDGDWCCDACCDINGPEAGYQCHANEPVDRSVILAVLDAECQSRHGSSFVFVAGGDMIGDICTSLYCVDSSASNPDYVTSGPADDHAFCGSGMWCEGGVCTESWQAQKVEGDETCPLGDRRGPAESGGSAECSEISAADCYAMETACCETCQSKLKPWLGEACRYGDMDNYSCWIAPLVGYCTEQFIYEPCCGTCCSTAGAPYGASCHE